MRGTRIAAVGIAALTVLVLASSSAGAKAPSPEPLIDAVNDARGARGIAPLRVSQKLSGSSRRYARKLMRNDYFGHASTIQAAGRYSRLGEVLAIHAGWKARPRDTVRRWLRSAGHRAAILDPGFRLVGAAPVRGRFGSRPATIWVAQLGTR